VPSRYFSIGLPSSWIPLAVDGAAVQGSRERVVKLMGGRATSSQVESIVDQLQRMGPTAVQVWAIKPTTYSSSPRFISMLSVIGAPAPGETLAHIESALSTALAKEVVVVSTVRHKQVHLVTGDAVWFGYTQTPTSTTGAVKQFSANAYVVYRQGYAYMFFFATLKAATSAELREFAAIAGSVVAVG
jgi:hypothetical protein